MIMIIEDDNDIRELLKMALEMEGYEVLAAENGHRALELIEDNRHQPQLALLDLNMPGMSGQELIQHLHQIPTIVLSAASKNVLEGVSGVEGVLQKPVDFDVLFALIDKIILNQKSSMGLTTHG